MNVFFMNQLKRFIYLSSHDTALVERDERHILRNTSSFALLWGASTKFEYLSSYCTLPLTFVLNNRKRDGKIRSSNFALLSIPSSTMRVSINPISKPQCDIIIFIQKNAFGSFHVNQHNATQIQLSQHHTDVNQFQTLYKFIVIATITCGTGLTHRCRTGVAVLHV